jgi:lipopolysaccharide transport system permease protein
MPHIADVTTNNPMTRTADKTPPTHTVEIASRQADADDRPVLVIRPPSFSVATLWQSAGKLAQYRDLLYTLSAHRLQVRYKQSLLGPLWAILQPLALLLIYTVIFGRLAGVESEGIPYTLFAFAALLPWTCFSTAVSSATNSLVSHFNLVTKVYFPREILPLTYVIAAVVDLAAGGLILAGLLVYRHWSLTMQALWLIPVLAVMFVLALAVSLVLSAIQVRFRDIGMAMPLLLQVWMFATPIVYPLSAVPPHWRSLYMLNPMVGVIDNVRRVLLHGTPPDFTSLGFAAGISIVLLMVALLYFKRIEATVADVL